MNTVESPSGAKKTGRLRAVGGAPADGAWPQAGDCAALSVADPVVYATVPDRVQDKSCRDGAGDPSLHRADGVGGRPADADA